MKIKLEQDKILKIFVGLLIASIIVFLLGSFILNSRPYRSVQTAKGTIYSFREDVKTANKSIVYPNDETLRERFLDRKLTNITYIFVPGDSKTNGYYTVWAVEFGFKLTQFYNEINYVSGEANIIARPADSTKNISNQPTVLKLIIVPFNQSSENKIIVDKNNVYLYGRSPKEMDYVVIKAILVALGNWTLAS